MTQEALVVQNVSKEYPTRAEPLRVLEAITFSLEPGTAMSIMGPSGSGKSTLLHILGTLERPSSGTVRLGDADPFALSDRDLAAFRNRSIGFVFQDHHLLPQCSALENVLIPSIPLHSGNAHAETRARHLLEQVGLAERLDHLPAELSGGERQRVAIARAFINQPTLILADEPTGNLDRKTAATVADLMFELARSERTTMIVVTHSPDLASRFAQRTELIDGRLQT